MKQRKSYQTIEEIVNLKAGRNQLYGKMGTFGDIEISSQKTRVSQKANVTISFKQTIGSEKPRRQITDQNAKLSTTDHKSSSFPNEWMSSAMADLSRSLQG
jgi:hypothetical protein